MFEPARSCFELDMAAQAVRLRPNGDDGDKLARAVVQQVRRDYEGRPDKGRLVADGLTEIEVVDLSSPDQSGASHS